MATADYTVKAFDTFPPLVVVFYDTTLGTPGKVMDLSTASAVRMIWKGSGAAQTGTMTMLTVASPTGDLTLNSNVIQNVSSFTNVVKGGSILHANLPKGAIVGDFDSTANTITVTDNLGNALPATASLTAQTLTLNRGSAQYTWSTGDTNTVGTYSVEFEITWPGGIQTVPNGGYRTLSIVADLEGA